MKTFEFRGIGRKAGFLAVAGLMAASALVAQPRAAQADGGFNPQNLRTVQMHNYNYQFTGRVANITGDSAFNLKMHGDVYNVYTERPMTHRLNKGDRVEVAGVRVGRNDIRHAHVRIVIKR